MISTTPTLTADEVLRLTGWEVKPEGLCKGEVCLPFASTGQEVEVAALADRLDAALVHDPEQSVWAMGPAAPGDRPFLADAEFPDLTLPDLDGQPFSFSSLRGRKVVMVAWASW